MHSRIAVLLAALLVTACGAAPAASPTPQTASTPEGDSPAQSPASGATETPSAQWGEVAPGQIPDPLPDQGDLVEVQFAQSVPAASFAALYVARELNFFGYHGVELTDVTLQSNVTALQAIIGGSLDLTAASATDVLTAQDADLLGIQNFYMATLQVCVNEEWASSQGITPEDPLEERLAALEGTTIGISGVGALSDRLMRYLLIEYGGLAPDTDTELVQIGGPPSLAASLDADQIQAFLFSPPACRSAEQGMVLVQPSEVPELENFLVGTLYSTRDWIEDNPDVATAVATALSMGNNFALEYPEATLQILQKQFPDVDPAVLEDGFMNTIHPQIRPDGLMDEAMWEVTSEVLVESGGLDEMPDVSEGVLWTNDYIDDPSLPN